MSQVTGKIQSKQVKAFQWGNRIALKVGEEIYSVFENTIKNPDNKALLNSLKEGDEVQIDYTEEPSKDGKTIFKTITGLVKIAGSDYGQSGVEGNPESATKRYEKEDPAVKARSVALRYALDWAIANIGSPAEIDIVDLAETWSAFIINGKTEEV